MTNLKTIQRLLGLVAILLIVPMTNSVFGALSTATEINSINVIGNDSINLVCTDPTFNAGEVIEGRELILDNNSDFSSPEITIGGSTDTTTIICDGVSVNSIGLSGNYAGVSSVNAKLTVYDDNNIDSFDTEVFAVQEIPKNTGRSCSGDCYHPHLGVDQNSKVFYEDGLKVNGITYKIDNVLHNHPEKVIELPVGQMVTMKAKVQDTYPDDIERCELSIGIPKGKFDKSLAAFKIGINRSFDGQVTNYFEGDLEAFRDVSTSMVNEENVVMCTWHFTPTKHLEHDMFAVEVMDSYRYTGTYYINEGVTFRGISEVGTPVYDVMDSRGRIATITIVDLTLEDLTEAVDQDGNLWHLIDGKWAKDFIRPDMSCNTTDRNCASGHKALILAQQEIAKKYFDASAIQGELKPAFTYDYPDRLPRGEQAHKTASSVCENLKSFLSRNPDVINHSSCKLE